jgi:DNA repair protein RecO (recombination protein O)
MALGKSGAVVIGSFPLGETDRVVTFFSRQYGKLRGVARAARRMKSRFGGALELLTVGELVFFDNGRSDLVRVDHFDVLHPFDRVREDLDRLGQAAWIVECLGRLTGERDANAALYGLVLRALRSLEAGAPPRRVAVVFGSRMIDALGHRLRLDVCVGCGRRDTLPHGALTIDVEGGGLVCAECDTGTPAGVRVDPGTVATLRRVRGLSWDEAVGSRLGRAEGELRQVLERHVATLIGQAPRASRFVREMERFSGDRR